MCIYQVNFPDRIECIQYHQQCCLTKCKNKLQIQNIKTKYPRLSDIPKELLYYIVFAAVIQDDESRCHDLHKIIKLYYEEIDDSCKYEGVAYRWTTKKFNPEMNKFYNFSLNPEAYTGGTISNNQKRNHLNTLFIKGINMSQFIQFYCKELEQTKTYIFIDEVYSQMLGMAEKEQIIIGTIIKKGE